MFKKILAVLVCASLTISLAACSGGNKTKKEAKVTMNDGVPSAPGDVFKLPDVKSSSDNSPIIATATKQAAPDDSITLVGQGFTGAKAYVYSQTSNDDGKVAEAKTTVVDDTNLVVTIDSSIKYGMYGVYVQNDAGTSDIKLINKPSIWWVGLTSVNAGDQFSIYGENLTYENAEGKDKSYVYLVSENNKYCEAEVVYADPYKVTVNIPDCLTEGEKYTVRLHNGHGGDLGFADASEQITFLKEKPVSYNGKTLDVTDFGAIPNKKNNDDADYIQAAIDAANDGDTIYFPRGTYLCKSSLVVDKSLKFEGAGTDKTIITASVILDGYVFDVRACPVEFTGIAFEAIREKVKMKAGFIHTKFDNASSGAYSIYIHGCKFTQSVSYNLRSTMFPIDIVSTCGAVIEDNIFETTGFILTRYSRKITIRNNDYKGVLYCGNYYDQNSIFMVDSDMFDVDNNKLYGKDIDDDDTGRLDVGDMSVGRSFAIQGSCNRLYIAHNDIQRAGLPDDNAGEQIMLENTSCAYNGLIKSSTESEVTMPDDFTIQVSKGFVMTVIDGKGKGQYRNITSLKGKVITVDKPWAIIPDASSRVFLTCCFNDIAIYKNSMDGYTNYAENPGATTGVQAYGNITNMFITDNEFKNMPCGITLTPIFVETNSGSKNFVNWVIVSGNKIERCCIGINYIMTIQDVIDPSSRIPGNLSVGVAIRKNSISRVREYTSKTWSGGGQGIAIGRGIKEGKSPAEVWDGDWVYAPIIEKNVLSECENSSIYIRSSANKVVLRENKYDDSEAKYSVGYLGKNPIIIKK